MDDEQKLLVITVGTVAAGVGQEFLRQMNARPAHTKRLRPLVRSIDTTHLPSTYSNLLNGEWFSMSIDPQFMDAIQDDIQSYMPELQEMMYTTPPETSMAGGGGIRYNGAGAVVINKERVRDWLKEGFNELASQGDRQKNIAVALVISAVGATGSGSLIRLIEVIIGAAQMAGVATPLHLDTFILQPGTVNITDLGLANTVGLYSELAASQLKQGNQAQRRYQGRTIVMGWGDGYSLASLEQLQEVTATLIRVVNDPIAGIAAQYLQRVVDNHVLQDLDARTKIPSHLSAATAITISLGNLEEQFIERDVSRLYQDMIIGRTSNADDENSVNIFQDAIAGFLQGNSAQEQYDHLLESVSGVDDLQSTRLTVEWVRGAGTPPVQAARLRNAWQTDLTLLASEGRKLMEQRGRTLAEDAVKKMIDARQQAIERGVTLNQIRRDYNALLSLIQHAQGEAQRYDTEDAASKKAVEEKLNALERAGVFGRQKAAENALRAVKDHIRTVSFRSATLISVGVLKHLARHCTTASTELSALISDVQRVVHERDTTDFEIQETHLLSLAALTEQQHVREYYAKVSVFARPQESEDAFTNTDVDEADPLSRFRRWIRNERKFGIFFGGDFQSLNALFFEYVSQAIHEQMRRYTVLDVLLEKEALSARLAETAIRAEALISFNRNLASKAREVRHVIASHRSEQQKALQGVIDSAFKKGGCTLIRSDDPTEIVVFYYVDGLPASSIKDLTGRCLEAFLQRRSDYHSNNRQNTQGKRTGVPVYSGRDAEILVRTMQIICRLYEVRDRSLVKDYSTHAVPDLNCSGPAPSDNTDNTSEQA